MALKVVRHSVLIICIFIGYCDGWRAVPANQAMYAIRSIDAGQTAPEVPDELLPRSALHSTYKFGYCPPEVIKRQFLRSTVNMSFETFMDSHTEYIYVVSEFQSTMRWKLQCVVMTMYVPKKYLFLKSRIPMYYCQGTLLILMFDTVQRLGLHEFYMQSRINMPMDITFQFYHPNII